MVLPCLLAPLKVVLEPFIVPFFAFCEVRFAMHSFKQKMLHFLGILVVYFRYFDLLLQMSFNILESVQFSTKKDKLELFFATL